MASRRRERGPTLPRRFTIHAPGLKIRVRQQVLDAPDGWASLGCVGPSGKGSAELLIHERQSETSKHVTLLHELLHVVEGTLIGNGTISRPPPHIYVEYAAVLLVRFLTSAGVWRGVTARQARDYFDRFIEEERKNEKAKAARRKKRAAGRR